MMTGEAEALPRWRSADATPARAALISTLEANGYVFLPRYAGDGDPTSVAAVLGEPIAPWGGTVVQRLVPREVSTPNTYSGLFGLGRFPFHTDLAHWRLPPRYLVLRCVKGYVDVPTLLLDGRSIIDAVTLDILRRSVVRPRRPRSGEMRLLRLWECGTGGGDLLRWDEVFLRPASRVGAFAFGRVREELESATPMEVAMVDAGDTLVIDNWRMLHSRPPVAPGREDRCLDRVYLGRLH